MATRLCCPMPRLARGILLAAVSLCAPAVAHAQQIDDNEYLRFMSLAYPRLSRQTNASDRFRLYGDRRVATYRDTSPADGIDDDRFRVLRALALRFSPFMVQNTYSVPMDFRKLMRRESAFNLFVDTWDLARGMRLVHRETLDFNTLGQARCAGDRSSSLPFDGNSADCKVLSLLDEFDPERPAGAISRATAVDVETDRVKILFFDFPGDDPATWEATYSNPVTEQLRTEFRKAIKIYAHPFIREVTDTSGRLRGFEFVIQYWFYYPLNDGGNNHEGDWEHIDVAIAPRAQVAETLTEGDVREVLAGGITDDDGEQLVIQRVEYYFHDKVMTLDYARPNVYRSRDEWEDEWRAIPQETIGAQKFWRAIRRYAYRGPDEAEINTHPIAYIGADNKGLDQLLSPPGGRNQDSHGTFPFPGLYKTVGPAGSAEQIPRKFDHWEWFANLPASRAETAKDFGAGHAVLYDDPTLVDIVPDWERVLPLVRSDPTARRDWAWLVLPVRWGYPASASPLAGLVAHADMGNLGPVGPAYNDGWNRIGTGRGFEKYEPHLLPSYFPLEPQDGFSNNLGYFNFLPALTNLPPLDLVWRVVALPFRALFKRQDPIYYPEESVPKRFIGLVFGPTYADAPDMSLAVMHLTEANAVDVGDGALIPRALKRIIDDIVALDPLGQGGEDQSMSELAEGVQGHIAFYVGDRFVSSTGFRHSRHNVGLRTPLSTGEMYEFGATVNWWDIVGNIRYDFLTSAFKPFVTFGYGVNWYRLEDMTSAGQLLEESTGEWINNFWPPTWQYGLGAELMLVQSTAAIPKGIDVGVRAEFLSISSPTGIDFPGIIPLETFRESPSRWGRSAVNLFMTVSF